MTKLSSGTVHFTVTGEFITQQARSFWAAEDEPEKALRLLKCLYGITDAQIMDVLEGRSQLVGDSDEGVTLAPDNATEIHGLPLLSPVEQYTKLKRERDEAKDEAADTVQMAIGETVVLSSPTGLREVPFRKTKNNYRAGGPRHILIEGYEWEGIEGRKETDKVPMYRQVTTAADRARIASNRATEEAQDNDLMLQEGEAELEKQFADPARRARVAQTLAEMGVEREEPKRVPPVAFDKITSDVGWLSPEGKYYDCGMAYAQHNVVAWHLGLSPYEMDKAGWIRCTVAETKATFFHCDYRTITPVQRERVAARVAEAKLEVPFWLERE